MSEKFTFFWGGPFSQWHPCTFKDHTLSTTFNCAEQYMMAGKAITFGDSDTLQKIMHSNSPREQKKLGRKVKGFDEGKWNGVAKDIVYKGNMFKFLQNKELRNLLLATEGTLLVEASPYDKIWGIGLKENDPKALDRATWRGKNWLGEVLTQVREDIINNKFDKYLEMHGV